MPVYEYACEAGHYFDRYLPLAEYDQPQACSCGSPGRKLISRVTVFRAKNTEYTSPIDGRPITSEAARREDLARNNCVPYDPEMKNDVLRRRAQEDAAMDASVDRTVEEAWEKMPAAKRERLDAELTRGGLDLVYTRATPTEST
ncbi:MAG: zinc ribbon domain-containing protein [Betaproteobacteria bacterium]|nr:zinc ribbon domain-containing protein [Betaproteobacteria bacterium]